MDQSIFGDYLGGTLCYESLVILEELLGEQIDSNLKSENEFHVNGKEKSIKHTFIDFGKDEITRSRPHPIIDPSIRIERVLEEAMDPHVADYYFGYYNRL